jgi:peptide/nickel transport system substrate-binding protein
VTEVPLSYLPPSHPNYARDVDSYPYDIAKGETLLDEAGWKDLDSNESTPRTAEGVANVTEGTEFSITLMTSQAEAREYAAARIAADLAKCGIEVSVNNVTRSELYEAAPDGIVFGRKYDLAEFAWSAGSEPPCFIYETDEIANAGNGWRGTFFGGLNSMGFSNEEVDNACKAALSAGSDTELIKASQIQVQKILAEQLPSIPLFYFVSLAVSRADLCGLKMDVSSRSEFSNLESINYGTGCQ